MKSQFKKIVALMMVILYVCGIGEIQLFAAMNYVTAVREINPQTIYVDEEADVTLKITGTPPVNIVKPNDVILILDKSGSMAEDNRFEAMISSAKEFIDLFDFNAHQVGVVDFSSGNLTNAYPLSTDSSDIKQYLDAIRLYGGTDTHVAIRKAMEVLSTGREEAQPVIVLLTDGKANNEPEARIAAEEAKAAGIVFYTIALLAPNEDPNVSDANKLMTEMATTSHHHHFVLGSVGLMDIYRAIVKEIGVASAYDVVIRETLGEQFEIVPGSYEHNIPRPKVEGNTLTWDILELKANTLELSYKIRLKDGQAPGTYNVAPNGKITYKDYAGANRSYNMPNKNITVKYRGPVITSITPNEGDAVGGDKIIIKGENFRQGLNVKVGLASATDIEVVDSQTVTFTVPAGKSGECIVNVTNDDGQKATTTYHYVADPTITKINPIQGAFEGGTNVKITGINFEKGMKVYFDGQEANDVTYYNGYVHVKTPKALKSGVVDVVIENLNGRSATATGGYTYQEEVKPKLEITSITPNTGSVIGGESVTIKGELIDPNVKVYFGPNEVSVTNYTNSTAIKVTVPKSNNAGKVAVKIENPDGQEAILENGYEYLAVPAPEVTKVSPNVGELAGGEAVYIEGANLVKGVIVTIGDKEASVMNYYSPNRIRIKVPVGDNAGKVDVVLTNPDGQIVMLAEGYEYLAPPEAPAPEITKISPNVGELAGGEAVYVEGINFAQGIKVEIGGKEAEVLNYYSPTRIRIRVPAGDVVGNVDVVVTNIDSKEGIMASGYEYLAPPEELSPKITVLSIESGELMGGEAIYIEGENFLPGLQVTFGENQAELLNYYSNTRIRVKTPMADGPGKVNVTVTNPSGKSDTLTNAFEYNVRIPQITSLSATNGQLVGGESIYIYGKNFTSGLDVMFGTELAEVLNYYDSGRIRVRVPQAIMPGSVDVIITNPDGEVGRLVDGYQYLEPPKEPTPEITKCTTSSSASGDAVTIAKPGQSLYVHGTNFKSTSKVKVISADGQEYISDLLSYYNSIRIRIKLPVDLVSGTIAVTIMNGDVESTPIQLNIN